MVGEGLGMELELQKYFQQLQSNVAAQAKHWIPTPSKLNFESVSSALVVMVGFWLTATIVQSLVQKFFVSLLEIAPVIHQVIEMVGVFG